MDTGQQSVAPGTCPGCGYSIDTHAVYCPNCGRPYTAMDAQGAQTPRMAADMLYATAPVQTASAAVPPPLPAWADQPTTGGIAGLASGPALTPDQPIRSHKRRNILTAISTLVVIALIGGGAYWAYAAFASRTDSQLARYFPSNSVAFVSADLVAAQTNNFHINPLTPTAEQTRALKAGTGLDWKSDIASWIGRDIAVGVFPLASAQQAVASGNPTSAVGVVALAQSRDDNAARAAINKFTAHLKQQGSTLKQLSYKGFTLYATDANAQSGLVGTGSGWVLIASNANAAHAVIDRINGGSDALSDQQAFKDAIGNLPANHFGAYYVNLRQILNAVVPVRAPNGLTSVSIPFVESYPVAGGYLGWTDTGERTQLTFNAVRNPNIPDVTGDTTSFASLVPSDAVAYGGVGNLGKLVQAFMTQVGSIATGSDPIKSGFGVSASDPLAQQPAGIAVVKTSNNGVGSVFYVHVASDAAASQFVSTFAATRNWTAKPLKIAGQNATALYDSGGPVGLTSPPTNGAPVTETAHLVEVAMTLHNTLIIAPDTNTASLIAQVAQGSVANLTSNANFQKMVKAAPSGAAATGYISTEGLQEYGHLGFQANNAMFSHLDALAFTLVWNNSILQGTFDAGMHS